jgi:hypothetical protein
MVLQPVAQSTSGSANGGSGRAGRHCHHGEEGRREAADVSKPAAAGTKASKPASRQPGRTARNRETARAARRARTARIRQAFVASTELRPMAQQLATLRTPAAYAGVSKYALSTAAKQPRRPIWRWATPTFWTSGTRRPSPICARLVKRARNWLTTPIFWVRKPTTKRGTIRSRSLAARLCDPLSRQHLRCPGA